MELSFHEKQSQTLWAGAVCYLTLIFFHCLSFSAGFDIGETNNKLYRQLFFTCTKGCCVVTQSFLGWVEEKD